MSADTVIATERTGHCSICDAEVSKHFDRENRFVGCIWAKAGQEESVADDVVDGYLVEYTDRRGFLQVSRFTCLTCWDAGHTDRPGRTGAGGRCIVRSSSYPQPVCHWCGPSKDI